jgi:RNA recognition motif-containing protein
VGSEKMNMYIFNLPTTITEHEVQELVSPYGEVTQVHLLQDKHTGMNDGTAYVMMTSQEDSEQAILALDGTDYRGYKLQAKQADGDDFPTSDFW